MPVFPPTVMKKPAITQKRHEAQDVHMGAGAGAQSLSLDQPRLQQDRAEGRAVVAAPPGVMQAEKAEVFEENNKVGIKADELGEQQRQIQGRDAPECITVRLSQSHQAILGLNTPPKCFLSFSAAPDAKDEGGQVKGIPLPLNPAQVPNPLQAHHAKDLVPPEAVHHRQSESPSSANGRWSGIHMG